MTLATGLRAALLTPWRAATVLGPTQIMTWGMLYYPPVLTVPLIAADRGWSLSFTMGGFSLGLLVAGVAARYSGGAIDRFGGHWVMPAGALVGACGLAMLSVVEHWAAYLAVWVVLGVAISASLYDAAFASIGRIFGAGARHPITLVTFAGGFASTVSWPVTRVLLDTVGWRGTYLVYAVVLALVVAPLHAFALPRGRAEAQVAGSTDSAPPAPATVPASGLVFWLVAAAFAFYAFVPAGLLSNLLAMFGRLGIEPATAVAIGTLFGPCQVAARLCEFVFARNLHPIVIVRFAVGMLVVAFALLATFGLTVTVAAAFMMMLGLSNGLITIARGTVPLALFGATGYGRLLGRIAGPALVIQASAPLIVATVAERFSDTAGIALAGGAVLIAFACFFAIPHRPAALTKHQG